MGKSGERVLVTGGSGFIGSAISRELLAAGYPVRLLLRPTSDRRNVPDGVEVVEGDICDPNSTASAMRGVRHVIHAAADYRLWTRSPQALDRTNVEGTRIVATAALRAGVERFVHTSSVATLKPLPDRPVDEDARLDETAAIGAYKRSKVRAERLIERMVGEDGLPAVIVQPAAPVGPRDVRPTPTGRIVVAAGRGLMPAYVDTGLCLVHVDDIGRGHVQALQHGKVGERYILGGDNVTLRELLAQVARLTNRREARLRLPRGLAHVIALGAEGTAWITGQEPLATRDGVRMSRQVMHFDDSRARRDLGYATRPHGQGLADAVDWFRSEGYMR